MEGDYCTPHVQDSCDSPEDIQPRNDFFKTDNTLSSEQETSTSSISSSGLTSAPKVHIVLDKDTLERKKIILVVPSESFKSKFQQTCMSHKALTITQASNDQIESILQHSLDLKTFDTMEQTANEPIKHAQTPSSIVEPTSKYKQLSKGFAKSSSKKVTGQIGSQVQRAIQSTSNQPTVQATSGLQSIMQLPSQVNQPVKTLFLVKPSVKTISEVQPLLQSSPEVQLSVQSTSGLLELQSTSELQALMTLPDSEVHQSVQTTSEVQQSLQTTSEVQQSLQTTSEVQPPVQTTSGVQPKSRVQLTSLFQPPVQPLSLLHPPEQSTSWMLLPGQPTSQIHPPVHCRSWVEIPTSQLKQPVQSSSWLHIPVQPTSRVQSPLKSTSMKQQLSDQSLSPVNSEVVTRQQLPGGKLASDDQAMILGQDTLSHQVASNVQDSIHKEVNQSLSIQPRSQYVETSKWGETKQVSHFKPKKICPQKKHKKPINITDTAYLPTAINSSSVSTIIESSFKKEDPSCNDVDQSLLTCAMKMDSSQEEALFTSVCDDIQAQEDYPYFSYSDSEETDPSEEFDEPFDYSKAEKDDPTLTFSDTELSNACVSSDDRTFDSSDEEIPEETPTNKSRRGRPRKVRTSETAEDESKNSEKSVNRKSNTKQNEESESDTPKPTGRKSRKKARHRMIHFDKETLYKFVIEEKTENEYVCRNCKKVLITKAEAESHMVIHHPYRCYICSKTFSDHCMIWRHLQKIHEVLQHCTQCTFSTNTLSDLNKHYKEVHWDSSRLALRKEGVCHLCGVTVRTKFYMDKHMKEVHGEEASRRDGELVCPACNHPSFSLTSFIHHCLKHLGRYKYCKFEGCSFKNVYQCSVDAHYRQIHCGVRSYDCDYAGCSYKGKTSSTLKRHQRNTHSKVRNFHCPSCSKAFINSYHLLVHKRIHDDAKPIACKHCEYRCRQKAALNWHMNRKHPEFVEVKAKINYEQEPGVEAPKHVYKPGRKRTRLDKRKKNLNAPESVAAD